MKRFDVYISAANSAFEQRPEVLKAINMDVPLSIRNRVVNNLMHVFIGQLVIGAKVVGDYFRAFFNVSANFGVKIAHADALHDSATDARGLGACFSLQKSKHSSLANHATLTSFLVLVQI